MVLAHYTLSNVPVLCVNGKSMSLSEAKTEGRQLLAARYPADHEESLPVGSEEVVSINLLDRDLSCEADRDLDTLTRGPDIGSQASIGGEYGRLHEVCYVVKKSVSPLVSYFLPLAICDMETTSRASIVDGLLCALETMLSSTNTGIWELKSKIAFKNSEFDAGCGGARVN